MDTNKAVIELIDLLEDRDVVLPSNPYDARNLEDALEEFLDKHFEIAHAEGEDSSSEASYDNGFDAGYESACSKIYSALEY